MLSPEALEEAGEALARVYRGIEADMLNYLVDLMLSGGGVTSRSVTAAALLGQTHADELRRIIERHAGEVDAELRATVEKFMRASDADDMERLGRPGTERAWPRQMDATVRGLAAILQRDNLHMEQGALDAFLSASTEAITRVNSGASTAERALHRAVRRLERDGVTVVQYRDAAGNLTVRNRVDVAVRRHVRTQIAQDGARMTARAMDEYGVQLVEVSSHPNARPSHAAWQGQVYGWRGAVSIDGHSYEGLEAATGYGSVDGLLGANWDATTQSWANTDTAYYAVLKDQVFAQGSASYNAAMLAYNVAYQQAGGTAGDSSAAWTDYVNTYLDKAAIVIYTLRA